MMRILIVEDDCELADILKRALTEQLYHVELANEGQSAEHLLRTEGFDVIILDWMLPWVDGITVCRNFRAMGKTTPVILLTARDKVEDRILGLDAGADDYLVKPFSMGELLARVRALLRRSESLPKEVLQVGTLRLDPSTTYVQQGDCQVELTAKEFALMMFFMRHADQLVTRTEILENVWDANYEGLGNVVDVYVNYLRNKLQQGGGSRVIETVRGRGYILREQPHDT